ncbi:MAG: SxtJ family membrane protein [Cyclobacteriaceae bacterium]
MQAQDRFKTILVIVTGLLALAWIFNVPVLGKIGLAIGAISIFIPPAARAIEWTWFKIALALGWVNSRVLLSIIYFVFLMPLAWISRFFTKDPLALKKDKRATLFTTRDHLYTGKDLENIW